MASFGRAPLSEIWAMLDVCAHGHTKKEGKHYWCVRYNGKTYPTLPRGEHGKTDPEIQIGKIRQMVRQLGIETCAEERLALLAK
jgi:hypothetical protein